MKNIKQQKGFTLLYAVLVSSIVLSASLSIINISLKQHKLSALSRESKVAFYAANTGVDCALYWNTHDRNVLIDPDGTTNSDLPIFPASAIYDDPRISSDDTSVVDHDAGDPDSPDSIYCLGESILDSNMFYKDNGGLAIDDFYNFTASGGSYWDAHFTFSDGSVQEEYCLDTSNTADYRTWIFQVILPSEDTDGGTVDGNPDYDYSKDNACAVVSVCKNTNHPTNGGYNTIYTSKGYNTCDITKENVVERGIRLIQG